MMTPKAKAKELFKKYSKGKDEHGWALCEFDSCAKKCALIAVDEMINMCKLYHIHNIVIDTKIYTELSISYWQEVKQEIEKL